MEILIFLLNRISELTGLYFFSALLQADAAILGILGVFIIFRYQIIQSNIGHLRSFIDSLPSFPGILSADFASATLLEKEKMIEKVRMEGVNKLYKGWIEKEKEKVRIKILIRLPITLLGVGLTLNMIFLSIAEIIYNSWFWLILIMILTIIYHIFLFIKLVQLIFKAVPPIRET